MTFSFGQFFRQNYLALLICIFAFFGFIASFTLSVEKIHILKNPNIELGCDINSVFNCGTVMKSAFAEAYGIPLSFLGVAGYPPAFLVGLLYIDRKKTSPILSWIVTLGPLGAFILSIYFMIVSAYIIGVFCPWCILSAVSASIIFFALLTHQIQNDNLKLPNRLTLFLQEKIKARWDVWFVVIFFVAMLVLEWLPFYIGSLR